MSPMTLQNNLSMKGLFLLGINIIDCLIPCKNGGATTRRNNLYIATRLSNIILCEKVVTVLHALHVDITKETDVCFPR